MVGCQRWKCIDIFSENHCGDKSTPMVVEWCRKTTIHCLSQCLPISILHCVVTRPRWGYVMIYMAIKSVSSYWCTIFRYNSNFCCFIFKNVVITSVAISSRYIGIDNNDTYMMVMIQVACVKSASNGRESVRCKTLIMWHYQTHITSRHSLQILAVKLLSSTYLYHAPWTKRPFQICLLSYQVDVMINGDSKASNVSTSIKQENATYAALVLL